ncbi:hypothetical protein PF011_g28191 [Phytophthora fragariae]|uniref:Uncharacterized protein n=1 Tax=Phytophthora fragariae TaxID=53985 RepID=A0A6A3H9Q0_9STRA|nr:hypothetical protein PF011_g28191 [Phytophthora fragariae]
MLHDARNATPSGRDEKAVNAVTPTGTVKLSVIDLSDEETSTSSSDSEDQTFLGQAAATTKSPAEAEQVPAANPPPPQAPPTKVLFLDGIRGLAAMLVVVQHSREFVPELHLGSVALTAQHISRFLAAREKSSSGGLVRFTCMEKINIKQQSAAAEMK